MATYYQGAVSARKKPWAARIKVGGRKGKTIFLGMFRTQIEAEQAEDNARASRSS